jgi:hypothetical protein
VRRPNERLSQRRLVYELRAAIDRGLESDMWALSMTHPRAMRSAHVLHNLGARRRARLLGLYEAARSFVQHKETS